MSHTPHELHEEFPAQAERIHALKRTDAHFARLADEYHAVNREVHRAETGVAPMESLSESALRKKRSHLKDEIARILAQA
jgi:uncharacterized protein